MKLLVYLYTEVQSTGSIVDEVLVYSITRRLGVLVQHTVVELSDDNS
jgi:hypothetical protein